jgi:hypothetical protein
VNSDDHISAAFVGAAICAALGPEVAFVGLFGVYIVSLIERTLFRKSEESE